MGGPWAFRKQPTDDTASYWMVCGWGGFLAKESDFGSAATISKNMQGGNKLVTDKQRDGVLMTSRPRYAPWPWPETSWKLNLREMTNCVKQKFSINWSKMVRGVLSYFSERYTLNHHNKLKPKINAYHYCVYLISLCVIEFHCFLKSIKSISESQWCAKWSIPSIYKAALVLFLS